MSNIWKRSLSMFLAIVMVFGMLPMPAFADDTLEPAETPAVEQPVVEEPVVDEPAEEEPAAEDPPVVEEPVVEDPVEEPVVEEPVEEPVVEDPVEEPVVEDPVEEPVVEDPVEEPVVEDPVEEPVIEDEVLTLSGETRKVYFLNTEDWATVYAAWSFDEEDFADAEFPGGEMAADEELENVFVMELPVEADDVVFNDGVEVTEDLLAWEAENGIEAIHYYAAQLDETLDYFSADEQVEQEAPEEEVTEWLSYADVLEAWKKAQEAAQEAPAQEPAIIFEEITVEENVTNVVADAAADGSWYWDDAKTTLYIKDGQAIDLYAALTDDSGINLDPQARTGTFLGLGNYSAAIKYNADSAADSWDLGGTSADTSTIEEGTYVAVATTGSGTSQLDGKWSSTSTFTVKYFYVPSVTVTGKDGVEASAVTEKVISGGNITFTLPKMDAENWSAVVTTGTDSNTQIASQTVTLSTTDATTITVGPVDSAADATITVELKEAVAYRINLVCPQPWGTATASATSSVAGETITIYPDPADGDAHTAYTFSHIAVNCQGTGQKVNEDGVSFTMPEGDVYVEVYFDRFMLTNDEETLVKFNAAKSAANQLDALKQEIFNKLAVTYHVGGGHLDTSVTYDKVKYEAYRWETYTLNGNVIRTEQSTTYTEIGKTDDPYDGWQGIGVYTPRPFGYMGLGTVEHVKLTYNGLSIEADITLTESREPAAFGGWYIDMGMEYDGQAYTMITADDAAHAATLLAGKAKIKDNNDTIVSDAVYDITVAPLTFDENGYAIANVTINVTSANENYTPATLTTQVLVEQQKYTAHFYIDGSELANSRQELVKGEKVTEPNVTELPGHELDGWYIDSAYTTKYDFNTTVTESVDLYAKWDINTYNYTINIYEMDVEGNYPADPTSTSTESGEYNTTATVTPAEKTGFTVSEDSVLSGTIPAGDTLVLSVYYARNQYDVTWNVNGTETSAEYYYGASFDAPADPEDYQKDGKQYKFAGWDYNNDGYFTDDDVKPETVTEDVTYDAIFRADDLVVSLAYEDQRALEYYTSIADAVKAAPANAASTITVLKDYTETSFYTGTNSALAVMVNGNKNITLDFDGHTVTFDSAAYTDKKQQAVFYAGSGSLTVTGNGNVTYKGVSEADFMILSWTGNGTINFKNGTFTPGNEDGVFYSHAFYIQSAGNINVEGGSYTRGDEKLINRNDGVTGVVTATGGTFDEDILNSAGDELGTQEGEVAIPHEYKLVDNNNGTWTVVEKAIYTITFKPENGEADIVFTPVYEGDSIETPDDPTWEAHLFAGWDKDVVTTPDADATYTAQWNADADKDGLIDGSEADPYWTIRTEQADGTYAEQTNVLDGEEIADPDPIDKANAIFVKWNKTVDEETHTVTFSVEWNNNDTNNNNVDDGSETGTVTLTQTGEGNVTLAPAGNATLLSQEGNVYTYLWDSTDAANKVINITTTLIDVDATDGSVDYVISAPATANIGDTVYIAFGKHTLNANDGTIKINGYYEARQNSNVFDTLKADVLAAAGLTGVDASQYTVSVQIRSNFYDLDKMTGIVNILNYEAFFLGIEVPETGRKFMIKDNTTNVSKTVTMAIEDSRPSAGLEDYTETEEQAKEYDNKDALTDYVTELANGTTVNPNGVTVTVSDTDVNWPTVAGVATKMVYTVKYADSADYIGDEATITVYAKAKHNNCTVVADDALKAGGSLTVFGTVNNDGTTVPGNTTVNVQVTPSGNNVVETITVTKNGKKLVEFKTTDIAYSSKNATVTFTSDGSQRADEYVVSATYSENYLNLKSDETIVYCIDNDTDVDLKEMVFNAIFDSSSAPMTKDDVKLEFKTTGITIGSLGWADLAEGPAVNLGSLTHKFGESGSETIKLTYSHKKYGSFEEQVVLYVFDSCYNVEVTVQTITNGAEATIKTQYSAESREYKDVNYFKKGTELTITLTPDGEILDVLGQLYNGTYGDSMAYIKDVRVYESGAEEPIEGIEVVRGQGKLDLGSILQGVNPLLYNASVTFTLGDEKDYFVVVEYGILELERANEAVELPMYKGGKDYAAEVPTTQEIVNAVLGEEYAANFVATYGGAFKVEFSTDLTNYNWTEVSDEALLALNDGATVRVRITWKPMDGDQTYYPVAQQADLTLVDGRTPTSVAGEELAEGEQVNYVSEEVLVTELKEKLGLGIMADGEALDVEYTVTYTIEEKKETVESTDETTGETVTTEVTKLYADVTVTYDGSAEYKPVTKTFEDVPVANRPDDATIKVTIQNASDVVTNNDGKTQSPDPDTDTYTVIGNGTFNFKFIPDAGYAIESVTVTESLIKDEVAAADTETVTLTYKDQTASFSMFLDEKYHYEVVVETVESVWGLADERVYDFATGITTPDNSDIVKAATEYPTDIDFEKVNVEYLARAEGKVTVTLPDIDLGFTVIKLGTFDIDLGELWLNPEKSVDVVSEDQLDKLLDGLLNDVIFKVSHGELAANNALTYITNYVKNLPLGIHIFGANGDGSTETVRISYEDEKYLLAETITDVTIHDYRIATEIAAVDCNVTFGYSLAQLIAASGAQVTADGTAVEGLTIETSDLYLHANTAAQEVTLTFAGDENYQPSKTTINVIVNKASCDIDYDSQFITYGNDYDLGLVVSPTVMPDGTTPSIDRIEMMIGLDMNKLLDVDIEDKTVGINQAIAYIQLRLPESIRNLPLVGEYLQGEFTLGELTDLINGLSDILGIDENSMSILNQVLEAITGVTDNMDIKVRIKDEDFHPSNIGVYIAGAVTVDADFETAYTADYLIIAPKTVETKLEWDYTDSNGIMTLPAYQEVFADLMGAHVVETETVTGKVLDAANSHVKYLILGINDETSEFLYTDIYGNIKANIWTSNDAITDNGAYVQIAYMLNWGNEIYYAVPIVRSFVIVPQTLDVQLVGATGEPNNELLKTFNNKPQGFSVEVTTKAGEMIYSDHYQNVVELPATDEVTVTYVGLQTNTQTYNSTEKPVNAGAYAVAVTYIQKDEAGNVLAVGADVGVLVIQPAPSETVVDDVILTKGDDFDLMTDMVHVTTDSGVTSPDMTIISAQIASDGSFDEIGWEAVTGNVNIDVPDWLDAVLTEYAPEIKDGMTAAEFVEKLNGILPELLTKLEEAEASNEIINSLTNLVENISNSLANVPSDVKLNFNNVEDMDFDNVGVYVITAIVTDSDHMPSADSGLLVVQPDVKQVHLKWNYNDKNGIWTRELLNNVDLWATAYDEAEFITENADATAKITYKFIGIDKNGELIVMNTSNEDKDLPNGAYIQLAYIDLDASGYMTVSDLLARPVVLIPGTAEITMEDKTVVFDNTAKSLDPKVVIDGETIKNADNLTVTYTGVQTNGKTYGPTTMAPTNAGVYTVVAEYKDYTDGNSIEHYGIAAAFLTIEPAESKIEVTGGRVTYDGKGHTADVAVDKYNSDYTLISGGVYVTDSAAEVGVDDFHGNLNINFPQWFDDVLTENNVPKTITPADLIRFIENYRDEAIAAIPTDVLVNLGLDEAKITEKLNGYIDALLDMLDQLSDDVTLTIGENSSYTEPGYYFYYGIVTDSDRYPSTDTGLLEIVPAEVTITMDDLSKVYGAEDPELTYTVEGLVEGDTEESLNIVVTREEGENVGEYNITATASNKHYNITVVDGTLTITEAELTVIIDDKTKVYGEKDPEFTYTVEGLVNGDTGEDLKFLDLSRADGEDVGEYDIKAQAEYPNYNVTVKYGTLTITKATVGITVADATKVYGEKDPEKWEYKVEGLANGDQESVLGIKTKRDAGEDVGEYTINAYWLENLKNYNVIAKTGTFTITEADLTVIINDQTKVYGEKDPEFTYTVEGLVNGDTGEDLKFLDLSRADGEDVGEYDIKAQAEYPNYNVTVKYGTLTITKATVGITVADATKIYGEKDPEKWEYKVEGLVNGDQESVLGIKTKRDAGEDVGEYTITAYWLENLRNYDVIANVGTLTIKPKAATITAEDKTVVAGNEMPELTAVVEGLIEGDALVYELSADYVPETAKAGEIEIIVTLGENPNYEVETTNGILTVTEAVAQNKQTGIYYDSLQKGIDDAKNDETVILLKDITLSDADMVKTEDDRNVMLNVSGKSITLDLNEKTITVDYNGGKYLYAVVYVADGAELTVTGNGGIDVPENGINVTYMFWKRGTTGSLTIENGTYHMNDSADSMVYTNGSGSVTVKGGNWTLDTVGTGKNGSPWIFNAQGANERHITVTGGTYNFDINHQHWAHEVEIPEGYGLRDNKDGTWTVVEAVCYIVERVGGYDRKVGYEKLSDAIAVVKDGETIHFWKNIDENVTIKQTNGLSFTIDGEGLKYTGTITINGNKRSTGAETLTITDVKFTADTEKQKFIVTESGTYAHNITVENCKFDGNGFSGVYGMQLQNAYDITVKDVTADGLFELVYANKAVTGFTAENVKVTNSSYGFWMPYGIDLSFKDVELSVEAAGVYIGNHNASSATFENCTITAQWPVLLDNKTAKAYTLTFNGENTLTSTDAEGYGLTVNGKNANFKVNLNGTGLAYENTTGLAAQNVTSGTEYYNTVNYGIKDAASGETVKVLTDVTENVTAGVAGVTLDLNQKTITGNLNVDADLTIVDNTVNVESTKEQFIAAGEITGDIKIADGANLNLEAGTYKTDVNDYCADPIYVAVPKQKHENGTWTVMTAEVSDYVCWHVEEGVYYTDLSDALEDVDDEASETIQMLKDYTEKYVIIAPGTTLDLADQTVTATFVVGLGDSYLTGDINSGKLYVPTTNISLSEACYNDPKTGYDVLPVYMDGYYTFSYFRVNISGGNRGLKIDGDNIRFQFVADTSGWAIPELAESATNHKISIVVRLTWKNASETGYASQDFTYLDETISNMYNRVPGKEELLLTLDGFEALDMDMDTLEVKAMVVSNAGVLSDCEPQKAN